MCISILNVITEIIIDYLRDDIVDCHIEGYRLYKTDNKTLEEIAYNNNETLPGLGFVH